LQDGIDRGSDCGEAPSTCTGGSWPARRVCPKQLGSFAAIWDDALPPTPRPVWEFNLAAFRTVFTA
jgi:hypothetical protein